MAQRTKKRNKWWKKLLIVLLLIALAAAYLWFFVLPKWRAEATVIYDGYTASLGTISNSMDFSGSISVTNYETLTAGADGTVRQVYVAEEQPVSEGDKLLRLSSGETLKANFDGRVNLLNVETGDSVSAGDSLIQIVDFGNMQVTFRVDEYAIANIYVGQECRVTVKALEKEFDTSISHIDRIPSNSQGTAYYTVTADFAATDNVLPGMQVSVVIPQEEAVDAVILNKSALGFDQRNSAYVFKKDEEGTMASVPVEIGVDNDNYVEVLSGVAAGETVYAIRVPDDLSGFAALFSSFPMRNRNMPGMGGQNGNRWNDAPGNNFDPGNRNDGNFENMGGGRP